LIYDVVNGVRPSTEGYDWDPVWKEIMEKCWTGNPEDRCTFEYIQNTLEKYCPESAGKLPELHMTKEPLETDRLLQDSFHTTL
jgi:hypothetical protein